MTSPNQTASPRAHSTTAPIPKPAPGGPSSTANQLMDHLQKQLQEEDTTSISGNSVISTSSSGRRRRRRNKNKLAKANIAALGLDGPGSLLPKPKPSDGRNPKLKIDLDLDVELELKAKLKGDICLSLVVEDRYRERTCPELEMPTEGEYVTTELFYMRVGRLRFRRRWVDRQAFLRGQVFLTAFSAPGLLLAGFVLGLLASRWTSGVPYGHTYGLAMTPWVDDGDTCGCGRVDEALGSSMANSTLLY